MFAFFFPFHLDYLVVDLGVLIVYRSVLSAGPYHDTSEEGKFYAVVLEQMQQVSVQGLQPDNMIQSTP